MYVQKLMLHQAEFIKSSGYLSVFLDKTPDSCTACTCWAAAGGGHSVPLEDIQLRPFNYILEAEDFVPDTYIGRDPQQSANNVLWAVRDILR